MTIEITKPKYIDKLPAQNKSFVEKCITYSSTGIAGVKINSRNTIESNLQLARDFLENWDLKQESLKNIILEIQEKYAHESLNTKKKRFAAIKKFLTIAVIKDLISEDSLEAINKFSPKGKANPNRTYLVDIEKELNLLTEAAHSETGNTHYERALNALILVLHVNLGTRNTELLKLKISDIDLEKKQLTIRNSKRNKTRTIGCNHQAVKAIKQYLGIRPETEHEELIVQQSGKPYKDHRIIAKKIRRIAKKAGLDISCHSLRRTNARYLGLVAKLPLPKVAAHLGHGNDIKVLTECYCLTTDFEVTQAVIDTPGIAFNGGTV